MYVEVITNILCQAVLPPSPVPHPVPTHTSETSVCTITMCQIDSADKYKNMSCLHCWIRSYTGGEKAKRQSLYRTSDSVHRKTKARLKTFVEEFRSCPKC